MQSRKTIDHIVSWLTDYVEQAKMKGFVIGVSGGVDSALASTLAAETGFEVTCIEMPIHQNESQVKRAKEHIAWLQSRYNNVAQLQVNLSQVYDGLINALPKHPPSEAQAMSLVNTRARLRMTTLYYFAALESKLVVGTGNKVEDFGVGFYTKYGDGGVDLSPIADLLKTEVYKLAEALEVDQAILDAPPTDGLWGDDRTDEDQIGASYPELEWAMAQQAAGKDPQEFKGREREIFEIYLRHNQANQHKMKPIPVCKIPEVLKQ